MCDEKATPSPGYYAVIPASVRYDGRLPGKAALLYGEITALANAEGYCWASNSYFAGLYHVQPATIRAWIKALETCGYLRREEVRDPETNEVLQRRLWLIDPPAENLHPSVEKTTDPPSKNQRENITSNNNITPYSPPEGTEGETDPPDPPQGDKPRRETIEQKRAHWFECLWAIYPNHGGRAPALKRWMRMRPSLELARRIYRALQLQIRAGKWSPGYWPELRRWLLDERWEDEPPQEAGETGRVQEEEGVTYW